MRVNAKCYWPCRGRVGLRPVHQEARSQERQREWRLGMASPLDGLVVGWGMVDMMWACIELHKRVAC